MKNYRIHAGLLTLTLCGAGFATPRAAAQVNTNQIDILKWYGANRTTSFAVQNSPSCLACDGVANSGSNTVSKVRPSDGAILGTYQVGMSPQGLAFDGANIWVANVNSANVTKLGARMALRSEPILSETTPSPWPLRAPTSGLQTREART